MKKKVDIHLQDIVLSGDLIQKRIETVSFEDFEKDVDLQDMVLYRLEVVGEAVKRLPSQFRKLHTEIPWHHPAGMRDKLIHEYDSVDLAIVWDTITLALPKFIDQVKQLLRNL